MNAAALAAFITVFTLGLGSLTGLVWRNRRRTTPPPPVSDLDADYWLPPGTVYEQTVRSLGDPTHIDLNPPTFAW